MAPPRQNIEERFWRYAMPEPNSGCWLWMGTIEKAGYARFWVSPDGPTRHSQKAHRWSYQRFVGKIPDGLTLDHKCRVRCCVNPDHLEPATVRENVLRGVGISAENKRKTHCPRGHPYKPPHLRQDKTGRRYCLTCIGDWKRLYRARQRGII